MTSGDLERQVERALRQLPSPRAPHTLAPRVMRAVAAAASAAVAPMAGWRQWAPIWQAATLVAALSIALSILLAVPVAASWVANLAVARATASLWREFAAPLAIPAITVVAVMCTACALLVAGLKHVAWEGQRTSHL
jgi:hypothetical protein